MVDLCRTIRFFEIKNHTELLGTLEQLVGRPCPEGSRTILAQVHGYARPFCFGATCFSIQKPYVFYSYVPFAWVRWATFDRFIDFSSLFNQIKAPNLYVLLGYAVQSW